MLNSSLINTPLFIIGNPRSGTTLLRLMLTSHSKVVIPPECGFVIWLKSKYSDWRESDCLNNEMIDNFIDDLFECKKIETWNLSRKAVEHEISIFKPESYSKLCSLIYLLYGKSIDKKNLMFWGDKNNYYLDYLNELYDLYPNAKFLHIVRDGRDVACSYRDVIVQNSTSPYAPRFKYDISDIANEWSENVLKIKKFMKSIMSKSSFAISYEDLVSSPTSTLTNVCKWLEIGFEANMLNFFQINKDHNLEPRSTLDWKANTLNPVTTGSVSRYKDMLSAGEINMFNKIAASALAEFSYDSK